MLAGADGAFCVVDVEPAEEGGTGASAAGGFCLDWFCAADGTVDLSFDACVLSLGACAKAPVPVKMATAVVTNKDCFMILHGLRPAESNSCQLAPFQVDGHQRIETERPWNMGNSDRAAERWAEDARPLRARRFSRRLVD
jgi:hypothetical protein